MLTFGDSSGSANLVDYDYIWIEKGSGSFTDASPAVISVYDSTNNVFSGKASRNNSYGIYVQGSALFNLASGASSGSLTINAAESYSDLCAAVYTEGSFTCKDVSLTLNSSSAQDDSSSGTTEPGKSYGLYAATNSYFTSGTITANAGNTTGTETNHTVGLYTVGTAFVGSSAEVGSKTAVTINSTANKSLHVSQGMYQNNLYAYGGTINATSGTVSTDSATDEGVSSGIYVEDLADFRGGS